MEPGLMRTVESRDTGEIVEEYVVAPLVNTAYLMPFIAGPAFLGIPLALRLLLPDYLPAVPAAQVLALGSLFLGLAYVPRMLIVAHNWQLRTCWRHLPVVVFNVALGLYLVHLGYGLFGVALSSALSFLLLFAALFWVLWSELADVLRRHAREMLSMALPITVMLGLSISLYYGVLERVDNDYLGTGLSLAIYGAAYWIFYHAACKRIERLRPIRIRSFI
jgi:O-antigen/teichoic acid export membrane protein